MLYIHPDECVDCGACEPVCPVEAIYYEDDVPEQWRDYQKINADFFEDLGSPGGASKVGKVGKDHPVVAALAPQAEGECPSPLGFLSTPGTSSHRSLRRRARSPGARLTCPWAPRSIRCP